MFTLNLNATCPTHFLAFFSLKLSLIYELLIFFWMLLFSPFLILILIFTILRQVSNSVSQKPLVPMKLTCNTTSRSYAYMVIMCNVNIYSGRTHPDVGSCKTDNSIYLFFKSYPPLILAIYSVIRPIDLNLRVPRSLPAAALSQLSVLRPITKPDCDDESWAHLVFYCFRSRSFPTSPEPSARGSHSKTRRFPQRLPISGSYVCSHRPRWVLVSPDVRTHGALSHIQHRRDFHPRLQV